MANTPKTIVDVVGAVKDYTAKNYTSRQLLKDTVGWTGKNLLPNKLTNGTDNGITFTRNSDGSVTMNGTVPSTADVLGYYIYNDFKLPNGNYIWSTHETSDGGNIHYSIAKLLNGQYVGSLIEIQSTDNRPFTVNYDGTYDSLRVAVWIRRGTVVNNKTFYPMIRRADIVDDTYEPYHESVETMYEEEIHGVNLLKNEATTRTITGVTFTVNADKTITINGSTATRIMFPVTERFLLPIGAYLFSGVPNGANPGTNTGHNMFIEEIHIDGSTITYHSLYSGEIKIRVTANTATIRVFINAWPNSSASNLVMKPMLRKADIEDSTYRPYNPQAIQNQLNAQGVLGAKNLLENKLVTQTRNGMTYTLNSDGTFGANGTATAGTGLEINSRIDNMLVEGMRYKISLDGVGADKDGTQKGIMMYVSKYLNNISVGDVARSNKTGGFSDEFVYKKDSSFDKLFVGCYTFNNASFSNSILKPMIRLASDPDDTYVPYAMTNRELTEVKNVTVTAGANVTLHAGTNVHKVGKVVSGRLRFEFTGTLTAQQVLATLSDKPVADTYTIGINTVTNNVMPIIIISNGQVILFGSNLPTENDQLIIPVNFITA